MSFLIFTAQTLIYLDDLFTQLVIQIYIPNEAVSVNEVWLSISVCHDFLY